MYIEGKATLTQRYSLIAIGTLLLCLAISGASLWIDEGIAATLAMQRSLSAWSALLGTMRGSDPQTPGFHLYLWVWAQVFGTGEYALRLANLPWAALFTGFLSWGADRVLGIQRIWLIFCLSPFLWFYMNEARPYAMLMSLSMMTTVLVLAYNQNPIRFRIAPWGAMFSLLALWSVHMLTIVLAPSLVILLYITRPVPIRTFIKQWLLPIVITLPLYGCLAFYYLRTIISGKGGLIEKPSLLNLVFAIYEFLGFGGLGPPRNMLRNFLSVHTLLPFAPGLALGVLAIAIVAVCFVGNLRYIAEKRNVVGLFFALLAGLLITLTLSYVAHFRILGRHVATFYPLLIFFFLTGLLVANQSGRKLGIFSLLLLGTAWSVSDYRLRLLSSYQKDDYRDAAALAQTMLLRGEPVLWLADENTAKYYGLPVTNTLYGGDITKVKGLITVSRGCPLSWFQRSLVVHDPVLVVISDKPDLFDPGDKCRQTLDTLRAEHIASFSAFDAWQVTGNAPF